MVRAAIKPSPALAAAFIAVHAATAATLIPLDSPSAAKVLLTVLIAASLIHSVSRHALLKGRTAIIGIELKDRETASVQGRDGIWRAADVLGTSYVSPSLTVLNVRIKGHRLARHALIIPFNMNEEDFRRLRVILRWGRPKSL